MTRISATLAAILLLATQGFGATKVTAKVASKSTAKPYHITARNQFHIKPSANPNAKSSKAKKTTAFDRLQAKTVQHNRALGQHGPLGPAGKSAARSGAIHNPAQQKLARSQQRSGLFAHASVRPHQANPPTGHAGFVSATQIAAGGEDYGDLQSGSLAGSTAFITTVWNGTACAYAEITASGTGTFTTLPAAGTAQTPTASGSCEPTYVVGDVDGDGNSDIIEAYYVADVATLAVLLSNGDGTFTEGTPFSPTANGFTGGTLVPNAASGFLDIVVVDDACQWTACPSNIVTLPGNGDGTFGAATSVPLVPSGGADGGGYNVLITDFDGDGVIDVAENDFSNGELNVYLSSSAPTAYAGLPTPTPDGAEDACTATFGSLTGSSAIVSVNCYDDTVTVYNNDGTGAFSEGVYYPVVLTSSSNGNPYPEAATVADVNGDGNGDIVLSDDDGGDVVIMTGNGDGTVNPATHGYATGGYPETSAFVGDLNGDGLVDIVVADDNQGLVYMAGYGDGTFQAARTFYETIPDNADNGYGISVASGDFNGDGLSDVVVANCCDSSLGVTVFLSNPDGSLQPGVNYGSGGGMEYVTVADFNGDGKLDFAVSDYNNETVDIYTGTGSGSFITGPQYFIGSGLEGIASGTINNASGTLPDIAVLTWTCCPTQSLNVLLNDGAGGFTVGAPIALNAGGDELALAQLGNTVGSPAVTVTDVVIGETATASVAILPGNGDGTFGAEADYPIGTQGVYGVAVGDVDGDGSPDIAVAAYDSVIDGGGIAVLFGDGNGGITAAIGLYSTTEISGVNYAPYPAEVQIADVDGDGVMDLVYTNSDYGTVGVLFGTGTGSLSAVPPTPYFFDPVEFPAGGYSYGLTLANITGDGSPAAVTANDDYAGASTLINANGAAAAPNYSLSASASSINVADGSSGSVTITLTPVNFYSGTVTFSCANLPLKMTCTFTPASLTPVGNAALSTTVQINTAAPHGALRMPADSNPHQGRTSLVACLTGMGLFGLLLAGDWKNKRNRRVGILLGILVLGMMFSLVGCSSSSTPGTPIGAQSVSVTGTGSDGTVQAINVTVNVF